MNMCLNHFVTANYRTSLHLAETQTLGTRDPDSFPFSIHVDAWAVLKAHDFEITHSSFETEHVHFAKRRDFQQIEPGFMEWQCQQGWNLGWHGVLLSLADLGTYKAKWNEEQG